MGRLLNPKALGSSPASFTTPPRKNTSDPARTAEPVAGKEDGTARTTIISTAVPGLAGLETGSELRAVPRPFAPSPTISGSVMGSLGIYSLFFFFISPELNDISRHFLGVNAYVNWVSQGLLLIAFIASGSAGLGLRLPIGKMWAVLTFLMALTVLFSTWRSESLGMMMNYIPRCTLFFFAICAFVVDAATMRTFILAEIFKGMLILVICVTMGGESGGRFAIPDSSFYGSANDLALGLATSAGFFFYWAVQKNVYRMLIGTSGFIASVYYLLKTSSRGAFVGIAVMLLCTIIFSAKYRWRLLPIILFTPLLLLVIPDDVIHRLTFVSFDSKNATATTDDEIASLASQQEREELFRRSVAMMFQHPLFGVGIGEFMDAIYLDDREKGLHSAALGTHNSYTQVGAECGIPAMLAYIALLVMSIRLSYRVFKRSAADPRLEPLSNAAICIMASLVGYSVGTFFYHVAYGGTLPLLTGGAAGLWQAYAAEVNKIPDADPALLAG